MRSGTLKVAARTGIFVLLSGGILTALVLVGYFYLGGGGAGHPTVVNHGHLQMSARVQPDPPREQDERLLLRVSKDNRPVRDGSLALRYVMPAMGVMPETSGDAVVVNTEPGHYVARFSVSRGGTWRLDVGFASPEGSMSASFSLTTGQRGLTLLSSGSP